MFEKSETYTPAEARKANLELDRLVAARKLTGKQAGAHRRHIARNIRFALKDAYSPRAASRAKAEIDGLVEIGVLGGYSARAYRAHVTKRTLD